MCSLGYRRTLRVERMGRVAYGPMLALQERRHADVVAGASDDTLFLLEHDPVLTLGKNASRAHVLASPELLAARGIELWPVGRGGDVTYHGPGQLVAYPIVQLQEEDGERDIQRFVGWLEEIMIRVAADFGVRATRAEGMRGIWVGQEKLGAVGVRIAHWVTMHGLALNVATRLEDFGLIVPCGLEGRGVTSLEKLLGRAVSMSDVQERMAHHAGEVLCRETRAVTATAVSADPVSTAERLAS